MFYQLGSLQTWEVTCELFEYSNESLNTGIPEIDVLQKQYSINQYDWVIKTEDADFLTDENGNIIVLEGSSTDDLVLGADNDWIQQESDQFVDFSAVDPFSEGTI